MLSLSVIIPNYNNALYIEKCVRSVLGQTYAIYEVIIVDDCSTDNSREIISKLQQEDTRIQSIFLNRNKGVSNARNKGLEKAKGMYVTFLDSDDYYYNDEKIKNEMELIGKYNSKGKNVIAYSQTMLVNENEQEMKSFQKGTYAFSQGKVLTDFLSGLHMENIPRDYCVLRETVRKVGGYSCSLNLYEDLDLLIRLSKEAEFYYTEEWGTAYRQTGRGLSKRSKEEHDKALNKIRGQYYSKLKLCIKAEVCLKKELQWGIVLARKIYHSF